MKQRYGIIATLASCMLLSMTLHAADAPAPSAEDKPAVAKAKPDKLKKEKEAAVSCDSIAGSRIRKSRADCDKANQDPGVRDISAAELNNTGEMNINEALRKLDPRFN